MKMLDKADIINIIKKNFNYLETHFSVRNIGLFGSYAKQNAKESSDIDILVDFSKPITLFQYVDLEYFLSEKLGERVDLVSKDGLKPILKNRILEEVIYI